MKKKKILSLLLLMLLLFVESGSTVLAVGKNTNNVDNSQKVSIHQEAFTSQHELKGLFASCTEYFHAGNWDMTDATFTMYYTATTLVLTEISDFTISLNGQPVFSGRIPLTYGETQKIEVPLEAKYLVEGLNSIEIESYIRTNLDDPCKDDVSGASWMVIQPDSNIKISYNPKVKCQSVADGYTQLTSIEALENKESAVFISKQADASVLTAAGYVLSGIANNATMYYENIQMRQVDKYYDIRGTKYSVLISKYKDLYQEISSKLTDEEIQIAKSDALITLVKGQQGENILVVTSDNDLALMNAGKLFGNKELLKQTKNRYRIVSANEDVSFTYDGRTDNKLTQSGSYVKGPFKQEASFYVESAANRQVAAGSQATLQFRYADNLDFNRSLVTVYIGDTPLGSKKLSQANSNGDTFTVDIPNNIGIVGSFTLRVVFHLELPDLYCTVRKQDMPWAYVSNESTIQLFSEDIPYLLFDYYPSPFITQGRMNEVVIVIPEKLSSADIIVFKEVLLTLGRYQKDNSGALEVRISNEAGDLNKKNVISVGRYERNTIAKQLNTSLYFPFTSDGSTMASNEKMQIETNYGKTLGSAQLLYSPFSNSKNGLLLVTGVTDEGMLQAASYIGNTDKNWMTYGDAYVADNENVYCYRFGEDNEKNTSLLLKVSKQQDTITLLFVGTCILALLIITIILLFVKYRRKRG